MNRDKIDLDVDSNEYSRPNQKWSCGWAAEGQACPLGPSNDGRCRAICTPYRKGQRFYCNNVSALQGNCDQGPTADGRCCLEPSQCAPLKKGRLFVCGRGSCSIGPNPDGSCCQPITPCSPVRSMLARRKIFSLCLFAAAIGLALFMVGGPTKNKMIVPGNVTSHHSAIADKCSTCHDLGKGDLNDWMHIGLSIQSGANQTKLCMTCHQDLGNHARSPHTVDASYLAALKDSIRESTDSNNASWAVQLSRRAFSSLDQLECAVCHKEHHGSDFDLKRIADNQCQSCHVNAFHSFVDGHPEFSNYPYARRTRIYFDHLSHYGTHFRESSRLATRSDVSRFSIDGEPTQESCAACHQPDSAGSQMLVRRFEETCAACHADQIENDVAEGLPVFALPAIDPKAIQKTTWNSVTLDRSGDHLRTMGALPPIMRLLLSADDEFKKLDQMLGEIDLSNLQKENSKNRDAAIQYVDILRGELDLIVNEEGQTGIETRITRSIGSEVSREQLKQLSKLLEHDWIVFALKQFLRPHSNETASSNKMESVVDDGWYVRRDDRSLRYRPTGHADPLLKNLLDVSLRLGGKDSSIASVRDLYRMLSHSAAPGRCLKCHTVDRRSDGRLTINWLPFEQEFTKFSHQPHLVMYGENACVNCHRLKPPASSNISWTLYRPEFIDNHFRALINGSPDPNFERLSKSDCAACHKPKKVSQSCTTCHSYHVSSMH